MQDEIGYLSDLLTQWLHLKQARRELQDYAENLEEKSKERTKEVQEKWKKFKTQNPNRMENCS